MQKKIIALAVAGLMSSAAFAQSNVTIYGAMRVSVESLNYKAAASDKMQVSDQASRIGFKGSEDLGGGLKAVWQWESALNSTNNATTYDPTGTAAGAALSNGSAASGNTVNITQRNTFLGLSGGFGTVLVGTHDTPYKLGGSADLFGDTAADAQGTNANYGIIGRNGFDNRLSNVLAYISPTWSGFHFAVAGVAGEESGSENANGLTDAYSMVAVYENGPMKATLAREQQSDKFSTNTAKKVGTKLNLGYKMGAIGLGYTYEASDDAATSAKVKDKGHLASVSYAMGATTLGLQYGKFDNRNAGAEQNDLVTTTIGAYHALSKRTQAYVGYAVSNDKSATNADLTAITVGLNHSF